MGAKIKMNNNEKLCVTVMSTGLFWMILLVASSIEPQYVKWVFVSALVYLMGMIGLLVGGDGDKQ